MATWRQIGGDMTWERHGGVFAKVCPKYRQVELVRLTPWMEHDKDAAVTHGLYLVDGTTIDFDDLELDRKEVKQALRSVGMEAADFEQLEPEYKAEILASYSGYEESRSVDHLTDALPVPPEQITFWGGQNETAEKLASYDADMRREVLEANFETHFDFGELPPLEALEFALGGEALDMDLQGQDALAFTYATAVAGVRGDTDDAQSAAETVAALAHAPAPSEVEGGDLPSEAARALEDWERRYGDPSDEDEGIALVAQALASSMLSTLGFEWV